MDINTQTQLCGLLGNPVAHSLSPSIHNAAFRHIGLNLVYLAFPVTDVASALIGIRALGNIRGLSVTIPHKVAVVPCLDDIETTARHIGSVNTIVTDQGKLIGYNTDASGALRALREAGIGLKGQRVLILGSGGVARAITFSLACEESVQTAAILGVDEKERRQLVDDLKAKSAVAVHGGPLEEQALQAALEEHDLVIQCTPVGMYPDIEETVVPARLLRRPLIVMDVVYNPRETRLLREARAAGCRIISGVEMFVYQAAEQFELWTGKSAPVAVMRSVLESQLR